MVKSLKQRHLWILERLIQVYIEKGEPIASQFLVMRYKIGLSPATIRNDFQALSRGGYLCKFHISSGRVPTDKAWNFFLRVLEREGAITEWEQKWEKKLKEKFRRCNNWKRLINYLAHQSRSLGFCYLPQEDKLIQYGLKYLLTDFLTEQKFTSPTEIEKISDSLENFGQQLKKIKVKEEPLVLIGHRNPFLPSDSFSTVLLRFRKRKYIIGILGNKRMPYDKNIGLLRAIAKMG